MVTMTGPLRHLRQPAFLAGLTLGLSLSALVSQLTLETGTQRGNPSNSLNRPDIGQVSVFFPVPTPKVDQNRSFPASRDYLAEVTQLVRDGVRLPSHLASVTVLATSSYWQDLRQLAQVSWGSDVERLGFYEPSGLKTGLSALDAMASLCETPEGRNRWHLVVMGNTYVNIPLAILVVQSLAAPQELVIALDGNEGECSLEQGLVISESLLRTACSSNLPCQAPSGGTDNNKSYKHCFLEAFKSSCLSISQVFPGIGGRRYDDEIVRAQGDTLLKQLCVSHLGLSQLYGIYAAYAKAFNAIRRQQMEDIAAEVRQTSNSHVGTLPERTWESLEDVLHNSANSSCSSAFYSILTEDAEKSKYQTGSLESLEHFSLISQSGENKMVQQHYYYTTSKSSKAVAYQVSIKRAVEPLTVEYQYVSQKNPIHIVSYVPDDISVYKRFIDTTRKACKSDASSEPNCEVYMVAFNDDLQDKDFPFRQMATLNSRIQNESGIVIKVAEISGEAFSLGRLLQIVSESHERDDLVFLVGPDYTFTGPFLDTCAANTEMLTQVYYPQPLVLDAHEGDDINSLGRLSAANKGWATERHDALCVYAVDLQNLELLPKDHQQLYNIYLQYDGLELFESVDPYLLTAGTK